MSGDKVALLKKAIQDGCVVSLKTLLNIEDVETRVSWGQTLLIYGSQRGHEDIVQYLLSLGADVRAQDDFKLTSLHRAAECGHATVVKLLLDAGALINMRCASEETALHSACSGRGDVSWVGDSDDDGEGSMTEDHQVQLVYSAAGEGYAAVVDVLLQHGANPECRGVGGRTPLHYACQQGKADVVDLMLKFGVDAHSADKGGRTPLHFACVSGSTEIVKNLLAHGAIAGSTCKFGQTPLHMAAEYGYSEVVEILLNSGAQVDTRNIPQDIVVRENSSCSDYLANVLQYGDGPTSYGRTPLLCACEEGKFGAARILLKHGANVHAEDGSGKTGLDWASSRGHTKIVELLLEHGANVNHTHKEGTALHYACDFEFLKIAILLMKAGANVNNKDERGTTPLMLAASNEDRHIVELLVICKADVNAVNLEGKSAIHFAAYVKTIDVLMRSGADIRARDHRGHTLLHDAICSNQYLRGTRDENVKLFMKMLDYGAQIEAKSVEGKTPLQLAAGGEEAHQEDFFHALACFQAKLREAKLHQSAVDVERALVNRRFTPLTVEFLLEIKEEVFRMKSAKIGSSNISYYNILTRSEALARNEAITNALETFNLDDFIGKYKHYGRILYTKWKGGLKRRELLDRSSVFFSLLNLKSDLSLDCVENICHYLCDEDLDILIELVDSKIA